MTKLLKTLIALAAFGFVLAALSGCQIEPAGAPTVIVSPGRAEVLGGETCAFKAAIKGLPAGIDNTIVWSITEKGRHGGTFIDDEGFLTIDGAEKQPSLTIRAALFVDPSIFGQAVVLVTPPEPIITGLKLNAPSLTGLHGKTMLFSVSVEGVRNPPLHMKWKLVSTGHHDDTTFSGGLLTIADSEPKGELTVRVTSVFDPDFSDSVTITIASLPSTMKAVSPGGKHTAAIGSDGSLWAWGGNEFGQVGDGSTDNQRLGFSRIGNHFDWVSVSAGNEHTAAVRADGSLWAWGNNADGRTGIGTDNGKTAAPSRVGTSADWALISAGNSHTLAVKTNGTLWAWGNNADGRTGLGTDEGNTSIPAQVGTDSDWVFISAGVEHSFGIREDSAGNRTLWAWGRGTNGKLGTGDSDNQNIPVQSGSDVNWASVSAGYIHSMGVKTNGTLFAAGSTNGGLFGGGWSAGSSENWLQVGSISSWSSVSAGYTYTMAVRTDGTLFATGSTNNGQLGGGWGVGQQTNSFLRVGSESNWVSVFTGNNHTMGFKNDGSLWVWGANNAGQLGDGKTADRISPIRIVP